MAELSARDISFAYRDTATLDGVSLTLSPGVFLGILGVNGSGKSTLLNCLDDLLRPQSGEVSLDGAPLAGIELRRRAQEIAYVTQHSHANRSTVFETLLLGRKPYITGRPQEADYAKVEQVIADFRMEPLAHRYVDELSGGEYQKMVIARAFVQDTPVLLLDEPTNNLDLANQLEVLGAVREAAHRQGKACAAVLHDINLALAFCDELAFLDAGRLVAKIPVADVTAELISGVYGVSAELLEYKGRRLAVISQADSTSEESKGDASAQMASLCMDGAPFGDVASYFDARAEVWDATCKLRTSTARRLRQLLDNLSGAHVIDVACGTGIMVDFYLKEGADNVVAVDISRKMCEVAARKFSGDERVRVLCADILQARLEPVDVVVVYNAYPHFPDKKALADKVFDLLVPGGVCLIAHGMGRNELNGHHGAQAAGVSTQLGPAIKECDVWKDRFEVTALADEEDFYAIRVRKPLK